MSRIEEHWTKLSSMLSRDLPLKQGLPPASLVCTKRQPYWPKLRSTEEGRRGSQVDATRCKSNTITAKIIGLGEKWIASNMDLPFALCNSPRQLPDKRSREKLPIDWQKKHKTKKMLQKTNKLFWLFADLTHSTHSQLGIATVNIPYKIWKFPPMKLL